jgi:hypothetical protein
MIKEPTPLGIWILGKIISPRKFLKNRERLACACMFRKWLKMVFIPVLGFGVLGFGI